ncbi:hypothetical protein RI835_004127 [Providencia rettgeri]|nr:hypothetical protein [Providencia rettgeri]
MFKSLKSKILAVFVISSAVFIPSVSLAADEPTSIIPASAKAAVNSIQTGGLEMIDLIWPVLGVITAAFLGIKFFKRVSNKV